MHAAGAEGAVNVKQHTRHIHEVNQRLNFCPKSHNKDNAANEMGHKASHNFVFAVFASTCKEGTA